MGVSAACRSAEMYRVPVVQLATSALRVQVRAATRLAAAEGAPEGPGLQLQPSLLPMWGLQTGSTPLAAMLGQPMMAGSPDLQMQQPMPMQPMQQPVQPLPGQASIAVCS